MLRGLSLTRWLNFNQSHVFPASWQSVSCFGHGDETMTHSSSMSSILAILYFLYKATRRTLRNNSPEGSKTEQWIQPCVLARLVGWNLRWLVLLLVSNCAVSMLHGKCFAGLDGWSSSISIPSNSGNSMKPGVDMCRPMGKRTCSANYS